MNGKTKKILVILTVLTIILGIRMMPFLNYGSHPLGYDTGFYRQYIISPTVSFPNSPTEILGKSSLGTRIFIDILKFSHLPPDYILYGGYLFSIILVGLSLFLLTKYLFGFSTGVLALFLFAISPIQYTAYWYFLWKNAMGTAFLFWAFLMIEKKSYSAIIHSLLVVLTHTTTSIIFIPTAMLFYLTRLFDNFSFTKLISRKWWLGIAGILGLFIFIQWPIKLSYYYNAQALFLSTMEYLRLSAFFFPFAIIGLYSYWEKIKKSILLPFAIIALSFPIFQLPFYQRIFPFIDLVIIILASLGIKKLFKYATKPDSLSAKKIYGFIIFLFIVWMLAATGIQAYSQINKLQPLVSKEVIQDLESLPFIVPKNSSILTTTDLAPWVYGWSQSKVFAPGLINNPYSKISWEKFWSSSDEKEKKEFLNAYPKPLYLFIDKNSKYIYLPSEDCVEKLSDFIYKYNCLSQ